MPVKTYALREVSDLTFYDLTTGKPFLHMDYAIVSTNEHSAETVYARGGKGNPRRLSFDGNRESILRVSTQIIDFRLISLLSGASVVEGATNVFKREVLTAVDNAGSIQITLSQTPVANTIYVFPVEEDAVIGQEKTINVTDAVVTITDGVAGEKYVAYYQYQTDTTAQTIKFKSDTFPKYCKIIGDTLIKNETTGVNEAFQMIAYKAKPRANFTLTMQAEGDPTTLEIEFDLLVDFNKNMIDYIKY